MELAITPQVSAVRKWATGSFIFLLHVPPCVALATGIGAADVWTCVLLYLPAAFGVGVGLHRYFAHRSFRTSRAFQLLMAVLAASAFGDAIGFSGRHRLHHRFSDTGRDVHSPRQGFWFCWLTSLWDDGTSEEDILGVTRDLARYPELVWLHRWYWVPAMVTAVLTYVIGGLTALAFGFCLSRVLVVHLSSAVNYFGHVRGTRRYATSDDSRNNALLAVLTFGEGWHNNHHHYPHAARAGFFWWELDVFYYVVRGLAWMGVVWDVRDVPARLKLAA